MGIRLKILLAFILCFGSMAGVSLVLLQRSMTESYDAIERGDIIDNIGRVEQSFEASATSLKSLATDWAVWNEMYHYARQPNARWAQDNIGEASLAPANISMSMVFGLQGQLLTSSAIKIAGLPLNPLSPENAPYFEHIKNNSQRAQCGLVKTGAGPLLICWAGIVHTDAIGDVVGTVVLGRLLDAAHVAKLREQTKLAFALSTSTEVPKGLTAWTDVLQAGAIGSGAFWTSFDSEVYNIFYPVRDILKQDAGLISLVMPRTVHQQGVLLFQLVRQQLVWTVLIMTTLLGLTLHFMLVRRLQRFARQLEVLDGQSSWDTRIEIGGTDELGLVAANFNKLLVLIKSQMERLKELLQAKEEALEVIEATQTQLVQSEQAALLGRQRVSNLLNNSGQGFLSLGADLVIGPETSRACDTLLGGVPAGRNAAQVLAGDDAGLADLIGEVIPAALSESDPAIRDSMLSLLPAEIKRDTVLLKAEYKFLENNELMVVLTDMTQERRLETLLQCERSRLELIVMAVSDSRNFFDAVDAFRAFTSNGLAQLLQATTTPQAVVRALYREIHTYKGLLSQFSFSHTPQALHSIESRLADLAALGEALSVQQIAGALSAQELIAPFEQDLAVLVTALGPAFLANKKSITLSSQQVWQLEQLATRLLQGETVDTSAFNTRTLLNELIHLRKVNLNALLGQFDALVQQLAQRLEKEVAPLTVTGGGDIWIDPMPFQDFLHCLGHVFRNAVAHGLETPEDRWALGKNAPGQITCRVTRLQNTLLLSIADDGAGLDLEGLSLRAVATGLYAADEICKMAKEDIAKLIFRDNISLSKVTAFAGRGVGLAAVMGETQKLGGTLEVKTVPGKGTEFLFGLPLLPDAQGIQV
jgi:sensor domain CHASE-containing protein/signal transduction histidine kinase